MERIKHKPTAILTSDWHIREDTPICYLGDYWKDQWDTVDFISNLQKKYDCVIFHGGDLFDKSKPSLNLVRETMNHLPAQFHTIYGQHDLPSHNLLLADKCGINLLQTAKKLTVLKQCHWGQEPLKEPDFFWESTMSNIKRSILLWHKLVYKGQPPYPGATGGQSIEILHKYPQYDLLLFGDNHQTVVNTYGNQLLVNPGSMMRMTADQIDHKPCVFLWYAENNTVEQVFLPIEEGVISREHLIVKEERDKRIDAFISRLDGSYETTVSFEQNLEMFFQTNEVENSVKQIIYTSIE
jgi:DNA repair exonuclease SbcCD nuclease subunit